MLDRLGALMHASVLNKSRCSEARMIWRMLQLLSTDHPATAHLSPPHLSPPVRSALLRALTPLASHSVSVSELKLLFSLLAQQHVDASDCMLAELLTTISSMLQQQGPAGSFLLDGHNSGIQLPPIPKFSQTGYTFYTWLRVDSFGASLNTRITRPEMDGGEVDSELSLSPPPTTRTGRSRSSLKPRLLSLRDDQSRGLELYFYPHSGETACLRMRTPDRGAQPFRDLSHPGPNPNLDPNPNDNPIPRS
ncbi:MAG: hypothetical protein SGPRY_013265 [Prymnesium sp.]